MPRRTTSAAALMISLVAAPAASGQVVLFISTVQGGGTGASLRRVFGRVRLPRHVPHRSAVATLTLTGVAVDRSGNIDVADYGGVIYQGRSPGTFSTLTRNPSGRGHQRLGDGPRR